MIGYRLSEADKIALRNLFEPWDSALIMEVIWLAQDVIARRRKKVSEVGRFYLTSWERVDRNPGNVV